MNKKVIFLVGGPGSGKDILIKNVFSKFAIREYRIEQMLPILEGIKNENIDDIILISTNSYDFEKIKKTKNLFEFIDYNTSMVFVDVNFDIVKERLASRQLDENILYEKYITSKNNIKKYYEIFDDFIIFENNNFSENSIKEIENFCNVFLFLKESLILTKNPKKLLKKFSISKKLEKKSPKLSSNIPPDNVSIQSYPANDPGFPTAMGGIGNAGYSVRYLTKEQFTDFGGEVAMPSNFASADRGTPDAREVMPMQSYSQNSNNETIRKIKIIARNKDRKEKNGKNDST